MSKSLNDSNANLDTSTSNAVTDEGDRGAAARYQTVLHLLNETPKYSAEWFQLKEEEMKLLSHPHIKELSCTDSVVDNSEGVQKRQVDDLSASQANVEKVQHREAINMSYDRSLSGPFPCDSNEIQPAAKIGAEDATESNINLIASDLFAPSCTESTVNKASASNADESNEGLEVTRHSTSPTAHLPGVCDFEDNLDHPHSNTGANANAAVAMLGSACDESPPDSFCLHNTLADEKKSKKQGGIETLRVMNDESSPHPLSILFADAATEKLSEFNAEADTKSEQPPSVIQQPPAEESYHPNLNPAWLNNDVAGQSRVMRSEVNISYGLHAPPPSIQRDNNLRRASANVPSQSVPSENVHVEEEHQDGVLIPEAILVEVNAPVEVADMGVAELIEPGQRCFPFKKLQACLVFTFIAAILLAAGLTFYFTRVKSPSIEASKVSPSPQSSLLLPSLQPSFVMPSSKPSLSIRYALEKNVLRQTETFDEMEATNNRVSALNWITETDPMNLVVSDSKLFQRYILVLLGFEFSNLPWLLERDECNWLGVECDKYGHVIKLDLSE